MLERRSALGANAALGRSTLQIQEVRGWSLMQASAFASTQNELATALRVALGVTPPSRAGLATREPGRRILRISATRCWIIADGSSAQTLDIPPEIGSVTSLSHSRTRIAIEGPAASALLSRGIALNFDLDAFPVGHFASTGLHHTAVLVDRVSAERFEIYAPRTFSHSIWHWLDDAASTPLPIA